MEQKSPSNKFKDTDLLAIPVSIGMAFLFCWIFDMVLPKDIATLVALFSSITFGRYSKEVVRWISKLL